MRRWADRFLAASIVCAVLAEVTDRIRWWCLDQELDEMFQRSTSLLAEKERGLKWTR
jgi:hypothetical protein